MDGLPPLSFPGFHDALSCLPRENPNRSPADSAKQKILIQDKETGHST